MPYVLFDNQMTNQLSQQLQALLKERGISQTNAAELCDLSLARFHNYVSGTRIPDLDTLIRMADRFNVTTDYLLGANAELPNLGEVVLRLLELEGIENKRATVIAEAAQEALKLLLSLPNEGDARTRSRIAAQAAWNRGAKLTPPQ